MPVANVRQDGTGNPDPRKKVASTWQAERQAAEAFAYATSSSSAQVVGSPSQGYSGGA